MYSMGRCIILVDGENLVARYKAMLRNEVQEGKLNRNDTVKHIEDVFVWHPNIGKVQGWQTVRVNYYASAVGGDDYIADLERQISAVVIPKKGEEASQICPRVFKKEAKSHKTRIVDINITIDALRHSYGGHVAAIFLLTGDSDFLSLINEVMRTGTQVWLGALSSGLSPKLPKAVDRFIDLDKWFFLPSVPLK